MTPKHATARRWAKDGIPVFPCAPGTKRPATTHSFLDATTNLAQIDVWWGEADYNVAICPENAGWAVIDRDVGGDVSLLDLPPTLTVSTPSGGDHFYYSGSIPASSSKLGPNIDTRGRGSYVLVPPSEVDGSSYTIKHDLPIADLPQWLAEPAPMRPRAAAEGDPVQVEQLRKLLRHIDANCGYEEWRNIVAAIRATPIQHDDTEEQRREIAHEWSRTGREKYTGDGAVDRVFDSMPPNRVGGIGFGTLYAAAKAGGYTGVTTPLLHSAIEVFANAIPKPKRSRFYPEDDEEMDLTREPRWLVPGLLAARSTCMLFGPSGSGKSFVALDVAMAVATGLPCFAGVPEEQGPVFYAANEGREALKRRRRRAWKNAHGVEGQTGLYVMPAPAIYSGEEIVEFAEQIEQRLDGRRASLLIMETVSKMMAGLDATRDAPRLVRLCDRMVERLGCTVMAIHHTGHDEGRGPRDSSAYAAGFDTLLRVKGKLRDSPVIEVFVDKHKDSEERREPWTLEAKELGGSLVLQLGDTEINQRAKANPLEPAAVAGALARLGALTPAKGVTTAVMSADLGVEESVLRKAAKSSLSRFATGRGNVMHWHL